MNEAEIILISGRYGVRSDSQKLAEGLAILWLLQQLDQKMPKLHLQDRHSIAIAIWIGKSKKDWKQLKRKAARAGIAIARPKGWRRWLLVSSSPELFKNQPPAGSPGKKPEKLANRRQFRGIRGASPDKMRMYNIGVSCHPRGSADVEAGCRPALKSQGKCLQVYCNFKIKAIESDVGGGMYGKSKKHSFR